MSECTDRLIKAFPNLNPEQIGKYISLLEELKSANSMNMGKYNAEAKKLLSEGKLQELLNIKADFTDSVKTAKLKNYMTTTKGFKDAGEALLSKIYGSTKVAKGVYENFQGTFLHMKGENQNGLLTMLRQEGVDKVALSGNFDKEIADYIYAKAKKADITNFSKEVKTVGDLYSKFNIKMALDQQAVGIPIAPKSDFLFSQNHDLDKILPDPSAWVDSVFNNPEVDWEQSFKNIGITTNGVFSPARARKALEEMVDGFKSGMAFIDSGGGKTFGGGAVQLVFKSGKGFLEYNKQWGNGTSLLEGMMSTIAKQTEKTALVSMFGNNPISKIKQLRDFAERNGTSAKNLNEINKSIDYLQGKGNRAVNPDGWGAHAFEKIQQAKGLTNLVLLTKSGFSSLLDIPTTAFTLHEAYGVNIWKAQLDSIKGFVGNIAKTKAEKTELLEYLGVTLQDLKGEILSNYGGDYKVGMISKLNDTFMTMNGTNAVTSLSRTTAAELNARYLTNTLKNGSKKLAAIADSMSLSPKELDELKKISKSKMVSPVSIRELSSLDSKETAVLATKVGSYLSQKMFEGSPAPLMKQKIQMGRHLPKDDPARLAYEIGLQYKATLLKVWSNADKYIRSTSTDGEFKVDNWNQFRSVANVGLAMFSTAAMIQGLEDLVTGKDRKYDTQWFKSVAQDSGMLGVFLDFSLSMADNRITPPLVQKSFDLINHAMSEVGYATGISEPDRRKSSTRILPPMTLRNQDTLDRQIKLLEKNMPNHVLWLAFRNYILEESNARRR